MKSFMSNYHFQLVFYMCMSPISRYLVFYHFDRLHVFTCYLLYWKVQFSKHVLELKTIFFGKNIFVIILFYLIFDCAFCVLVVSDTEIVQFQRTCLYYISSGYMINDNGKIFYPTVINVLVPFVVDL